ncbi:MAG: hypothetical protein A3J51_06680 [Omnitrophica WOR_2 bacterium RIFCSPHIGHO2_02_FULL_45_21]|nr:MAG: hypothetical protein A3J51_06680 [Omnitrophica WOR_2 bacterium RIFCSPHIGHO2_02_FULL_45_21]
MFQSEKSIVIDRELEKVYAVAETYPRFVDFYKEKEIIFENQSKIVVKICSSFYGKILKWEGEGIKYKNKSIDFTQTKGLLKGLRATWLFEGLNKKSTRATIRTQFNFQFFFGKLFEKVIGSLLIPKTTANILSCLKNTVESNTKT